MRLLVVSLNFAPELTATGKYTGEMAAWLVTRGHHVDAIAGMPHYPEWTVRGEYKGRGFFRECLNGVNVMRAPHAVPSAGRVSSSARILMESTFSLASLIWWARVFFRPRYDAVIAICPPMQDAVMPWLYGLIRRVPWIFHVQDFQVDAAMRLKMLRGGLVGQVLYRVENFLIRRASRVSTITPSMAKRAVEKGCNPRRTWLVPNWADISAVMPRTRSNAFRNELGLGDEHLLVLYAGGMGAKQGLEVVVEAAAALAEHPTLRFAIVGTGADRSRLEAMAAASRLGNIQFLPVQPINRLGEMLAAGDIHLVIQRAEAADLVMPSKLTNILAAGRPSIATAPADTALHDTLVHHDCGLVCPPESAPALAEAIVQLAADPDARARMGRNARAYAEKYLDKDAILSRFEQQLVELAKSGVMK